MARPRAPRQPTPPTPRVPTRRVPTGQPQPKQPPTTRLRVVGGRVVREPTGPQPQLRQPQPRPTPAPRPKGPPELRLRPERLPGPPIRTPTGAVGEAARRIGGVITDLTQEGRVPKPVLTPRDRFRQRLLQRAESYGTPVFNQDEIKNYQFHMTDAGQLFAMPRVPGREPQLINVGEAGTNWAMEEREDGKRYLRTFSPGAPLLNPPPPVPLSKTYPQNTLRGEMARFFANSPALQGLAGAIAPDTPGGKILSVLDIPYQGLERILGTGVQGLGSIFDPEEYGSLNDFLGNIGSVWNAASNTFETGTVDPMALVTSFGPMNAFKQSAKMLERHLGIEGPTALDIAGAGEPVSLGGPRFVDFDLPAVDGGLSALVELRKRIAAGENPDVVKREVEEKYGVPALMREMTGAIALDPLNVIGPGKAAVALARGGTKLTRALRGLRGASEFLEATRGAKGFFPMMQMYKNYLVGNKVIREGLETAQDLTRFQRFLVGKKTLGLADAGTFAPPKWWKLWAKEPEGDAIEHVMQSHNWFSSQVMNRIDWTQPDAPQRAVEMMKALKTADPSQIPALTGSDALGRAASTIQFRAMRHGVNTDGLDDILNGFASTRVDADALHALARGTGAEDVFQFLGRLTEAVDNGNDPQIARWLSAYTEATGDALRIGDEVATLDDVKNLSKLFGDGRIPVNNLHFRGALMNHVMENTGEWASRVYGVKKSAGSLIKRVSNTSKAMQSPLMLGLNPGYFMQNALNGFLTMAFDGVFGARRAKNIANDFAKAGLAPARMQQLIGMGDVSDVMGIIKKGVNPVEDWGAISATAGLGPIRESMEYSGILEKLRRGSGKVMEKMPTAAGARKLEQYQSVNSIWNGYKEWMANNFKPGRGFSRMPAEMEDALREVDPRLVDRMYSAAQSADNAEEVAAKMFDPARKMAAEQFFGDVARNMGMSDEDVARLMQFGGLRDFINDEFARLPAKVSDSDIRKVFERVRGKAEDARNADMARIYEERFNHAAEVAKSGDLGELMGLMDEVEYRHNDTMLSHMLATTDDWDKIDAASEGVRPLMIRDMMRRARRRWNRFLDYEDAHLKGAEHGLERAKVGFDGQGFQAAAGARRGKYTELFDLREKLLEDFFSKKRSPLEFVEIEERLDQEYVRLTDAIEKIDAPIDAHMAAVMARHYGDDVGRKYSEWRDALRRFKREDMDLMLAHRRQTRTLPRVETRRAWKEFFDARAKRHIQREQEVIGLSRRVADVMPMVDNGRKAARMAQAGVPEDLARVMGQEVFSPGMAKATRNFDPLDIPGSTEMHRRMFGGYWQGGEWPAPVNAQKVTQAAEQAEAAARATGEAVPPRTLANIDTASLKATGFKGGRTHLFNAVNKDRVAAGLAPYADMNAVPLEEALEAMQRRLGRASAQAAAKGDDTALQMSGTINRIVNSEDEVARTAAAMASGEPAKVLRHQLPGQLPETVERTARNMLDELAAGAPGGRILREGEVIGGYGTTQPAWYGELVERFGVHKKTVENALDKIIKDAGKDKGLTVERVKESLYNLLAEGFETPAGRLPPDPEALQLLGRSADEVEAAYRAWDEIGYPFPRAEVPVEAAPAAVPTPPPAVAAAPPPPAVPYQPTPRFVGDISDIAEADSALVTPELIESLNVPDGWSVGRGLLESLPPGTPLTLDRTQRITAAMVARVFPGETGKRIVRALWGTDNARVQSVAHAVTAALPDLARMEARIAAGELPDVLRIGDDLAEAAEIWADLNRRGADVGEYLAQLDAFDHAMPPFQRRLIADLDSVGRSRNRLRNVLRNYARGADDPEVAARLAQTAPGPQAPEMLALQNEYTHLNNRLWQPDLPPQELDVIRARMAEIDNTLRAVPGAVPAGAVPTVDPRVELWERALAVDQAQAAGRPVGELAIGDTVAVREGEAVIRDIDKASITVEFPNGKTQRIPFRPEGDPPLPPGTIANEGGRPTPHFEGMEELYDQRIGPMLDEMERAAIDDVGRPPVSGMSQLSPELQDGVRQWARKVQDEFPSAQYDALRWAEYKRDFALLNYSRRYLFDTYLGAISPYEFWTTHSMIRWFMRSIDNPQWVAHYYKLNRMLNNAFPKEGQPSRLQGKVKIPVPWLPEWMGGGIFVDPLRMGLPLQGWMYPWEDWAMKQSKLDGRAEAVLQDWVGTGRVTQAQADAATNEREGDLWNQAIAEAQELDKSLQNDAYDLFSGVYAPSLPLSIAYQALRGTPERIGPLPITRYTRAITKLMGIGGPGGWNIEEGLRRQFNLPVLDQWADYRVDRELSNMAAEGLITADEAKEAMIGRSGDAFELATRREAEAAAWRTMLGGALGVSADVFPEGEQRQRYLGLLNRAARDAEANGDTRALERFFEEHPEYEARLALYNDKDDRLRNFTVDKLWQKWSELPRVYKLQAQQAFGQEFDDRFLSKLSRDYKAIPIDKLQQWAVTLGQMIPGSPDVKPIPIDFAPPQVAMDVEQFYQLRNELFNYPVTSELQRLYFAIPKDKKIPLSMPGVVRDFYKDSRARYPDIDQKLTEYYAMPARSRARRDYKKGNPELGAYLGELSAWRDANPSTDLNKWFKQGKLMPRGRSARGAFLDQYPELADYWDWRRAYLEDTPHVQAYIDEYKQFQEERTAPYGPGFMDFGPETNFLVTAHLFSGYQLPAPVRTRLERAWQEAGQPGESMDDWLMQSMAQQGQEQPIQ